MASMIIKQRDFHQEWLHLTIERLEERKQRGDNIIEMQTGELQHLFRELLSMHMRCDRLEEMLSQFAGRFQMPPLIIPTKEEVKK